MKRLHSISPPQAGAFPDIKDWLVVLDQDWDIPTHYLQHARQLRDGLLMT